MILAILLIYLGLSVITGGLYLAGIIVIIREHRQPLSWRAVLLAVDIGARWPVTLPRVIRHWRKP